MFRRHAHTATCIRILAPSPTLGTSPKRVNGDGPPKGGRRYPCGRTGCGAPCHRELIRRRSNSRAVSGGSSSTKVFDGTSDGGDSYTLSPEPQGTVLVWVDGLLGTDYSITGATLTFGTAPAERRRHRRLGHRRRRCPLRHRRLLPGPARGRGDPAPACRLARLHAARRPDRQPGLRRHGADRSGRSGRPEERRLDRHVTFTAAASAATFTFASEVAFAAGDRLTVLAPSSQDASLADISITFLGKRT